DGGTAQPYSAPFDFTQGGVHTIHFWSSDKAGNVEDDADAAHKLVLKIDKTDPSIVATRVPAANSFGWNNGTVSVAFDCADGETGVATCPATADLAGEGADQSVTRSVSDRAGNSASATVDHVN